MEMVPKWKFEIGNLNGKIIVVSSICIYFLFLYNYLIFDFNFICFILIKEHQNLIGANLLGGFCHVILGKGSVSRQLCSL